MALVVLFFTFLSRKEEVYVDKKRKDQLLRNLTVDLPNFQIAGSNLSLKVRRGIKYPDLSPFIDLKVRIGRLECYGLDGKILLKYANSNRPNWYLDVDIMTDKILKNGVVKTLGAACEVGSKILTCGPDPGREGRGLPIPYLYRVKATNSIISVSSTPYRSHKRHSKFCALFSGPDVPTKNMATKTYLHKGTPLPLKEIKRDQERMVHGVHPIAKNKGQLRGGSHFSKNQVSHSLSNVRFQSDKEDERYG